MFGAPGGKAPVTLTPAAVAQLEQLMARPDDPVYGLRIGVKKGGCAGMEYTYERGLLESGFKFRNPNVTESCGCGESIKFAEPV